MTTKEKRQLLREARNLGFVDDGEPYRGSRHNPSIHCLKCIRGTRFLRVQIRGDGKRLVSHGSHLGPGFERATTPPTGFTDLASMYRSIAFEWQRESRAA